MLINKEGADLTANDVEPFRAVYFNCKYIQPAYKQVNSKIEEEIYEEDLVNFCQIDAIQLDSGKGGKIKQRQMWDELKVHGWFGYFAGNAMPESLKTTLARHMVTKRGTLASKIQKTVQDSKGQKMSIQELQAIVCKK